MSNEEKKITLVTDDGGAVDFYVLEETRINGMSYLLVTDCLLYTSDAADE